MQFIGTMNILKLEFRAATRPLFQSLQAADISFRVFSCPESLGKWENDQNVRSKNQGISICLRKNKLKYPQTSFLLRNAQIFVINCTDFINVSVQKKTNNATFTWSKQDADTLWPLPRPCQDFQCANFNLSEVSDIRH